MMGFRPSATSAFCSIGWSKAAQRADVAVSGRITPTRALLPPPAPAPVEGGLGAGAAAGSPAPIAGHDAPLPDPAPEAEFEGLELFPHAVRANARPEPAASRARVDFRIRVPILMCMVPSRAGTENVVSDNISMLWATTYATEGRD